MAIYGNKTSIESNGTGINSNGTGIGSNGTGIESDGTGIESNGTGIESNGTGIESNGTGISRINRLLMTLMVIMISFSAWAGDNLPQYRAGAMLMSVDNEGGNVSWLIGDHIFNGRGKVEEWQFYAVLEASTISGDGTGNNTKISGDGTGNNTEISGDGTGSSTEISGDGTGYQVTIENNALYVSEVSGTNGNNANLTSIGDSRSNVKINGDGTGESIQYTSFAIAADIQQGRSTGVLYGITVGNDLVEISVIKIITRGRK